jgi:hypothetical protein
MIITDFDANYIKQDSIKYCSKLTEYTVSKNVKTNNFATDKYITDKLNRQIRENVKKYNTKVTHNDFMKIS